MASFLNIEIMHNLAIKNIEKTTYSAIKSIEIMTFLKSKDKYISLFGIIIRLK